MAKDPAFLFYPNDWLGGTMGMSFIEKGAYMDLLMMQFNRGHMTNHMIGQVLGQNLDELWLKLKHKFIQDEKGLWYNERLEFEQIKRANYTKSRGNNKLGKNQYSKNGGENSSYDQSYENHKTDHTTGRMENENVNRNESINKEELGEKGSMREKEEKEGKIDEKKTSLCPRMVKVFKDNFPNYPIDKDSDYSSCLQIAYKIAEANNWKKESVLNGNIDQTVTFWEQIVSFAKTDSWFSTRAISDYNKEWQRLIQKINKSNHGNSKETLRDRVISGFDKRFGAQR